MQISDEKIAEFQALYKQHFNKDISKEEALEKGTKLAMLIKLILKPRDELDADN